MCGFGLVSVVSCIFFYGYWGEEKVVVNGRVLKRFVLELFFGGFDLEIV